MCIYIYIENIIPWKSQSIKKKNMKTVTLWPYVWGPHRCSRPTSDRKGTAKCKERPVVVDAEPGSRGESEAWLSKIYIFTFCSPQARNKKGIFLPFHYLSQWEAFWNSNIFSIYPQVRGSKFWAPTVCEPVVPPSHHHKGTVGHEFFSSFVHCMARENPDLWWEMVPHFQTHMGNAAN